MSLRKTEIPRIKLTHLTPSSTISVCNCSYLLLKQVLLAHQRPSPFLCSVSNLPSAFQGPHTFGCHLFFCVISFTLFPNYLRQHTLIIIFHLTKCPSLSTSSSHPYALSRQFLRIGSVDCQFFNPHPLHKLFQPYHSSLTYMLTAPGDISLLSPYLMS